MRGPAWILCGSIVCLLAACGGGAGRSSLDVPEERLASAEARARGRQLYVAYCSRCHGADADGEGVGASMLTSPPADFTSPAWQAQAKPEQVYLVIERGVPGTSMPAWAFLPEGELWDLTAYLLSLGEGTDAAASIQEGRRPTGSRAPS